MEFCIFLTQLQANERTFYGQGLEGVDTSVEVHPFWEVRKLNDVHHDRGHL